MSSIDMLFVQALFTDTRQTKLYGGAHVTGFAIIQFIAPVALVMFARVAQSVARSERNDSLGMTLAATLIFGVLAAVGCTLLPELPLRLMYSGQPGNVERGAVGAVVRLGGAAFDAGQRPGAKHPGAGAFPRGALAHVGAAGLHGRALFASARPGADAAVRRLHPRHSNSGRGQRGALPVAAWFSRPKTVSRFGSGFGAGARSFR